LFMVLSITLPGRAIDYPDDPATIEALISLHKLIKREEDKSLQRITTSFGEQSWVTKGATKFNEARSTLDSKLNNAYSYVILGAALAGTGTDLYKLIRDYGKFTSSTTKAMFRKPQVAWYYAEANYALAREVKAIKKMYVTLSATGINVMRASMDEKLDLVYELKDHIGRALGIIDDAYLWAGIVTTGGFHYDYIWDILNSDVTDGIAREVISKWNKES
jgi:hypothetical protein